LTRSWVGATFRSTLPRRMEDILGEAHIVGVHHALRRAGVDAPFVVAALGPGPVIGIADLVFLVHLLDLGGVFDHHLFRANEISKDVVAWPVPADAPFDRVAIVA